MGMDLIMGGHLTHGSPVNRSGKYYELVSYTINPHSEKLDYAQMLDLALEHKPRLIIGGFSSYPFAADWHEYRKIADAVGAYLLADVAHVAGLIAAGVYPNPVGIADVVSFTTHKTLNGPRGAVLITHRRDLSRKIDRAVFPGEQGGPHINAMAGLAVALRLATTEQFRELQRQTLTNAERLAAKLQARGIAPAPRRHEYTFALARLQVGDGCGRHGPQRRHGSAHPRPGRHRGQPTDHPWRQLCTATERHPAGRNLADAARHD